MALSDILLLQMYLYVEIPGKSLYTEMVCYIYSDIKMIQIKSIDMGILIQTGYLIPQEGEYFERK